ncbi:hypothetical protein E0H80_01605 [Acinetobacter sp. ANC 4779]|uniref:VOC family protein n=1 Tax=Acinetobacter sp. ANC 4779 TaxID=2529848 RepID=UPI00103FDA63|nr:VOC family protein [Acinetobacter sp. ANC 4779]TCB52569.1 hypothetical protein E0H80_01605 [Acinetobacter sp. ANC 4779]
MEHNNDSLYLPAVCFKENTKAAVEWHCSIFPNSQIMQEHEPAVKAESLGAIFLRMNGDSSFITNPSISFLMICDNRSEIGEFWKCLIDKFCALMQLPLYPWSNYCRWLQYQYGFSWQIVQENLCDISSKSFHARAAIFKIKSFRFKLNIFYLPTSDNNIVTTSFLI